MSNKSYSRLYRNLTQKILDKIVTPQVLGSTSELEQNLAQNQLHTRICYVLQDASLSNTVLIDKEAQARGLPSVFSPLILGQYNEDNSMLALNEQDQPHDSYHYSARLIRLIEALQQHPDQDVQLVPVTVLWGRAPEYEDSWFKALFADAWAKPNKLKQTLNISLYGRENYIEFHKPVSLRALLETAQTERPNFSPAHFVVQTLDQNFNQYKEAILGPDLSDRRNLINKLMKTEAVQQAIRKESIDKKVSMFEAENRAKSYLTEIVSDFSYSTLRFAELALTKLWTQLYDGIEVHHFDTVRELAKDYEIVYTPCHRSHIDYLLLSYVIFNRGLMVPHIAAGINLNLPVVGQILRGGGAYFIRRTFSGNALYTSVFKEYLHSLLSRNTPLEYFIEGGRSRTGLLLPPKKGMLSMTVQSHLRGATKPIAFIPTYFGYEKLMEGTSYLNELNGKPKEAESLWGILNSARKIEKVFGQVYVNFGEPVFLDNILQQNQADQIQLSIHDELPRPVINTVDQAAREILENINKAVVINPISLISTILLNAPQHALSQDDLLRQIEQYRELLKATHYDDRMIITQLSAPEIIEYALKLKQVEHYQQDNQTWIRVAESQRILLSYFSNNILHCLSLPALIALLVQDMPAITTAQLKQHVSRLYPFLKSELFLKWSATELPAQIDRILSSMQQLGWIEVSENIQLLELQATHPMHSLATLARSSLNNFVLISQLLQEYAEPYQLDLKALEKMAKTVFKRLAESGNLNSGYYFDSATLKSFMGSLQQLGLLEMQGQQLQLKPQFDTEISDYLGWYAPELQQQIADKLLFSEKEIKQFKEYSKK
ncbi:MULTISPECIES: glycerol-3-phosphate 1-O-acyltransferase PlsB [Acinetobacter]|uniref:glycerol-3-phosphate 1-O-acyltransferase PlsB n=1 Tax=Acinetobacter TaxID=469 RepID=UPI0002CECEEE|nr:MULTISPECIES: glycerol-3-phosphate 1-O-acyltransferase PlsB [Acinetobacter]ENW91031.1 glycerol-3-phosphate O-acyltransferase [Acinetobacter sp. CIP 53.82]MBA0156401.1 glycerol-3-phosphate 1-O-acyltransferase PlsB [Acinetobacter indicus]